MVRTMTLGKTGITTPQNAFGALPVQRDDMETGIQILRRAYDGGMTFFDTARAYTDSEEKIGNALSDVRDKIFIATKTMAKTPEDFWKDLETSLRLLKTDYVDLYQFHCVNQAYVPGDGTGMYECMLEAKAQGKIRHIGITAHKLEVAFDCVNCGYYETLQYPFSYLAADREVELVKACKEHDMGFIAMKGLAGGLITNSKAAFAFISQFDNVLPIWGVQHMHELEEWLAMMEQPAEMTEEIRAYIEQERKDLMGDFCRGCGYCMPCPQGIMINQCARISLMVRRAPTGFWLGDVMQAEVAKVDNCTRCGACMKKCPYSLPIPDLLRKNKADYERILRGEKVAESARDI